MVKTIEFAKGNNHMILGGGLQEQRFYKTEWGEAQPHFAAAALANLLQ